MAIAAAVVLVGAGVVALGMAGNGDVDGGGGGEGGDGGTPVASGGGRTGEPDDGPADLTLADLEPALLTTEDVPPGYVVSDDDDGEGEDDEPLTVDDVETDPACQEVLEQLEGSGADEGESDEAVLTAELERPDDNASVTHDLWLGTPGDRTIGEVADLLRECDSVSYEADEMGTQAEMRMSVEEVDGLGDDAIAVEVDIEIGGALTIELQSHGLLWSRDGVESNLFVDGAFDEVTLEALPPDRDLARSAAEAVDERIREVTGG